MQISTVISDSREGNVKILTPEKFWSLADITRMQAEYKVDKDLQFLQTASPEVLKRIFVQYRFFTIYYITDLALLISKIPFGTLRTCLAEFLSEELGDGDPRNAHPELYDEFLRSLGVDENLLNQANGKCIELLDDIRSSLQTENWAYGVGLRGMGGECLCQLYLSSMYDNFIQNPFIRGNKQNITWKFWEIHIGDVDIHHRELTRSAISELIISQPETITDLADGYLKSKGSWDLFWRHIYNDARNRTTSL